MADAPAGPDRQLPALRNAAASADPLSLAGAATSANGTAARHAEREVIPQSGVAGTSRTALVPLLTDGVGAGDAPETCTRPDGGAAAAAEEPAKVNVQLADPVATGLMRSHRIARRLSADRQPPE